MSLTYGALIGYLRDSLSINDADRESELFSSGLLDSVSMVNLLAFIEQSTGISIRAEDVTLENFSQLLSGEVKGRPGDPPTEIPFARWYANTMIVAASTAILTGSPSQAAATLRQSSQATISWRSRMA